MVPSRPDSILIWGPPASGKSSAALAYFCNTPGSLLITPSATMAEHLRNQLARSGDPVRPSRILTLAQFLDQSGAPAAASPAALDFAIEAAIEQLRPARFRDVAAYPGFRKALAALIQEAGDEPLPGELGAIAGDVRERLVARNTALHSTRVKSVQGHRTAAALVIDGFFTFAPAELALIQDISRTASVILTLPDWQGAEQARSALLTAGFVEQRMAATHRKPSAEIFRAANIDREVEEIAQRIIEEASRGRDFREMGVVLRSAAPYAAALRTTFARFGIPARFYFAEPLRSHPAIQFLAGIVDVMLKGWDHAELLALLRIPVAGLGATDIGDNFDFALRDRLPGRGLPGIASPEPLNSILSEMNLWTRERLTPHDWSRRCSTLRALIPPPALDGPISRERFNAWSSTAAALDAFDAAIEHAAELLGAARASFEEFWPRAKAAIDLAELRIPDRRRDVVHVIDVFEARQWELPIVFVCGMIERHFPQYHREDAILDDAARRAAGLKTSVDLQREERSLYQLAISRATQRTILSYPRFDERGEQTLPSFFLGSAGDDIDDARIRPRPARDVIAKTNAPIEDRALLQHIAAKNRKLSPSSIETYLQCPFQFFARRTLKLRERPPSPRDRLNALLQGTIIHAAIAELERMPLLGEDVLDAVFDEECARHRIPLVYRTETVRLDMLRSFTAFLAKRASGLGWKARVEEPFEIALTPELSVRGRIDRLEVGPNGEALVIDYKYSAANAIKQKVKGHAAGEGVQAGLYLLAAVQQFGLKPAGMLYCGLRNGVEWGGWHVPLSALTEIGESCTPAMLDEMTAGARSIALSSHASILKGEIEARPTDLKKCEWCDYRDICRIEVSR